MAEGRNSLKRVETNKREQTPQEDTHLNTRTGRGGVERKKRVKNIKGRYREGEEEKEELEATTTTAAAAAVAEGKEGERRNKGQLLSCEERRELLRRGTMLSPRARTKLEPGFASGSLSPSPSSLSPSADAVSPHVHLVVRARPNPLPRTHLHLEKPAEFLYF